MVSALVGDPHISSSYPVEDGQGYGLIGEIAHEHIGRVVRMSVSGYRG